MENLGFIPVFLGLKTTWRVIALGNSNFFNKKPLNAVELIIFE
jgi:hypothetical protein